MCVSIFRRDQSPAQIDHLCLHSQGRLDSGNPSVLYPDIEKFSATIG